MSSSSSSYSSSSSADEGGAKEQRGSSKRRRRRSRRVKRRASDATSSYSSSSGSDSSTRSSASGSYVAPPSGRQDHRRKAMKAKKQNKNLAAQRLRTSAQTKHEGKRTSSGRVPRRGSGVSAFGSADEVLGPRRIVSPFTPNVEGTDQARPLLGHPGTPPAVVRAQTGRPPFAFSKSRARAGEAGAGLVDTGGRGAPSSQQKRPLTGYINSDSDGGPDYAALNIKKPSAAFVTVSRKPPSPGRAGLQRTRQETLERSRERARRCIFVVLLLVAAVVLFLALLSWTGNSGSAGPPGFPAPAVHQPVPASAYHAGAVGAGPGGAHDYYAGAVGPATPPGGPAAPGFLSGPVPDHHSSSSSWGIAEMLQRWLQSPALVAALILGSLLAVGGVLWYLGVLVL
ncbi:unnamed protein product [Amoebophrya sp. A120]|nr:unnamed protein product [Amoebophrya sp. A120]|eukprot:GSA120T00017981001.1